MHAVVLKDNATKCSFLLKEIYYLGYAITWDGIKTDPKKVQGSMDPRRPATTTEAQSLICIVYYYRDMCPMCWNILTPLIDAVRGPKGRKIVWNYSLEDYFKEIKHMISYDMLFN